MLTGKANIHLPGTSQVDLALDAGDLLPDWTPTEILTLLNTAIFNDIVFDAVRFRHSDIKEVLAAEWFSDILSPGSSRVKVEKLVFREKYNKQFITTRLRPVVSWLIIFDQVIRKKY
ncbi:hypothetical protein [Aliamphritea spongicola]|nr:hypothetical protein [Aliamphritea spongicola]